jgi:hypothetical protein
MAREICAAEEQAKDDRNVRLIKALPLQLSRVLLEDI